jgi:hypothetical protein
VVRRWRWTFWLILVAFLFGVLRVPVAALQLTGVLAVDTPAWYVLYQPLLGVAQFGHHGARRQRPPPGAMPCPAREVSLPITANPPCTSRTSASCQRRHYAASVTARASGPPAAPLIVTRTMTARVHELLFHEGLGGGGAFVPRPRNAAELDLLLPATGGVMGTVQVCSLDQPDETWSFPNGAVHDAWVVGDEPWVTVDFSQAMADYAKPGGAA